MNAEPDLRAEHVLVTGGAGFIGGHVVAGLVRCGAVVRVADRRRADIEGVEQVVGDLRDPAVRDEAVAPGTTAIVHLAADTSVLESKQDPAGTHENNVEVTAALLELARQREVGRFVLASTNAVVGNVGHATITEDTPLRPLTPYGATKAAGEMLASAYAGSYDLLTTTLRLSNVYGPGMSEKDSFVPRLMRAARDHHGVDVYGDGEQVRDLVHVDDVVQGLLVAWQTDHVGPLVVAAGHSVSVLDLVASARRATGAEIPATHVPAPGGEMPAVIVAVDRARALGYEPRVSLDEGLAGVWQEFAQPVLDG